MEALHTPVKKKKRKRSVCSEDEREAKLAVSFSGRVRNKVSRPGTVDILKLGEDFMLKEGKRDERNKKQAVDQSNQPVKKYSRRWKPDEIEDSDVENEMKRTRGKRLKRKGEEEEFAAKKKKRMEEEFAASLKKRKKKIAEKTSKKLNESNDVVEQIRSGLLKIINIDELRDQLAIDRPTQVQLLENVKYLAIPADNFTSQPDNKPEGVAIQDPQNGSTQALGTDPGTACSDVTSTVTSSFNANDAAGSENASDKAGAATNRAVSVVKVAPKSTAKFMYNNLSEKNVEMILQRVEKAAEEARLQKEAASHKRKHRQTKKPLTVAQVLAIKRNNLDHTASVLDESLGKKLDLMVLEAQTRGVALEIVLQDAVRSKDKEGIQCFNKCVLWNFSINSIPFIINLSSTIFDVFFKLF